MLYYGINQVKEDDNNNNNNNNNKRHRHLERLGIKVHVPTLQKSALLGTANILRKVLSV